MQRIVIRDKDVIANREFSLAQVWLRSGSGTVHTRRFHSGCWFRRTPDQCRRCRIEFENAVSRNSWTRSAVAATPSAGVSPNSLQSIPSFSLRSFK